MSRRAGPEGSAIRFLLVGVANTAAGLLVIYGGKYFLRLPDVAANLLGYAVGIGLSFSLNKRWSFEHRGPVLPALARFLVVIGAAYAANLVVVLGSIHALRVDSYAAHALGVVPYMLVGYLGSRYFAFADRGDGARAPETAPDGLTCPPDQITCDPKRSA